MGKMRHFGKYRGFLMLAALCGGALSGCGDDDGDTPNNEPVGDDQGGGDRDDGGATSAALVLEEVRFDGSDRVEIRNAGDSSIDLSSYWLCANRSYNQLSALNVVSGDLDSLAPSESVIVEVELAGESDLGLYLSNSFGEADALVDYLKWGQSISADRESVAVAAGQWTAGDFVDVTGLAIGSSLEYDGEGDASADWVEQTAPTLGDAPIAESDVIIREVRFTDDDRIEIENTGGSTVDLSEWFLCSNRTYVQLSELSVIDGALQLRSGESLIVRAINVSDGAADFTLEDEADLALYRFDDPSAPAFGDAQFMRHYVDWGTTDGRTAEAISAGLWTEDSVVAPVSAGSSIVFDGEGSSASDWNEDTTPSLADIRLAEVRYNGFDRVELRNDHDAAIDLTDWLLCIDRAVYPRLGDLTVVAGSLQLQPGEAVIVAGLELGDTDGDLGLYLPGSSGAFGDAELVTHYVLWGAPAAGSNRSEIAALAELWTEGESVPTVAAGSSIQYAGPATGASQYSENETPTLASTLVPTSDIIIRELRYTDDDRIELENTGDARVDISGWWLCANRAYAQLSDVTVVLGDLDLEPGESVVVKGLDTDGGGDFVLEDVGELGLYATNSFGDPSALRHYVNWGATADTGRASEATTAGLWPSDEALDAVPAGWSLVYDGIGIGADSWTSSNAPTLADIRLQEVRFNGDDRVEIVNDHDTAIDVSGFQLCHNAGNYQAVGAQTIEAGATLIPAGGSLILSGYPNAGLTDDGDLGLYISNGFGDEELILSYVKWGDNTDGLGREAPAIAAGIWGETSDTVAAVAAGSSIEASGLATGVAAWSEQPTPTLAD
ncbi:MAG: hypothetical protein AAF605_04790 [Myxococcota bacterium]